MTCRRYIIHKSYAALINTRYNRDTERQFCSVPAIKFNFPLILITCT